MRLSITLKSLRRRRLVIEPVVLGPGDGFMVCVPENVRLSEIDLARLLEMLHAQYPDRQVAVLTNGLTVTKLPKTAKAAA